MSDANRIVLAGIICAVVGIGVGVLIGYFSRDTSPPPVSPPTEDPKASKMIMDEIKASNIEENLRILTDKPHISGLHVEEVELVNFVADRWREAGLEVEIHPYDVLLSYPDPEDSNFVAIKTSDGNFTDKSHPTEAILDPSQNKSGVVNPFNAYSATGDPEGDLVYVNYASIEDFIELNKTMDLEDKICMARYGSIFRGDKAFNAKKYKCAGLIIYSDPADYTVPGEGVYPESWYLPGTGAQRGSLLVGQGDPLTLHYPSIDTAWRKKEEDAPLPFIPVTPIGYDDAILYLSKMAGDEVPESWRGGLNITYRYGPGFTGTHASSKMRMHVTTSNQRKIIHNVIGYIEGAVEPDRYVLMGNHRDAWVFGAMDPSSGTASMLEVARAYGEAVKNGWRPRRTIVFCSWAAEEFGVIGSSEWVEEFYKPLTSRAVAYLNTDMMVFGNYSLLIRGMHLLRQLAYDSTKLVENPDPKEVEAGHNTLYDTWESKFGTRDPTGRMLSIGSGSDFTLFLQLAGVTCLDMGFMYDPKMGMASYPVYHSVYETFDLMEEFVDRDFKFHEAGSKVLAEMARGLADSPLIPFNAVDYANQITEDKDNLLKTYQSQLSNHGMDTSLLDDAMVNFTAAAKALHERIDQLDLTDALALRAVNDQLMQIDRAFIDKEGVTGRDQISHVIYAASKYNRYGGTSFPGMVDSLFEIDTDPNQEARWDEVRRQYSILLYHIGSAASTLRGVVPMKGYSNL